MNNVIKSINPPIFLNDIIIGGLKYAIDSLFDSKLTSSLESKVGVIFENCLENFSNMEMKRIPNLSDDSGDFYTVTHNNVCYLIECKSGPKAFNSTSMIGTDIKMKKTARKFKRESGYNVKIVYGFAYGKVSPTKKSKIVRVYGRKYWEKFGADSEMVLKHATKKCGEELFTLQLTQKKLKKELYDFLMGEKLIKNGKIDYKKATEIFL